MNGVFILHWFEASTTYNMYVDFFSSDEISKLLSNY